MIRRRAVSSLLLPALLSALCATATAGSKEDPGKGSVGPGGYRLVESTAASVNGQVLYRSDLLREACLLRCGALPGDEPADRSLAEVRERRIRELLVLQEEEKLGLGSVDNAALLALSATGEARVGACADPCARDIDKAAVRDFAKRRLVIREFLRKRVGVFVEVSDDEVRKEIDRRVSGRGIPRESLSDEAIRAALVEEKTAQAVRNWYDRVTSKSKIVRSPLEER